MNVIPSENPTANYKRQQKFCPACYKIGVATRLKLYQVNLEQAVFLCPNYINCHYPQTDSWILIDRNVDQISENESDTEALSDRHHCSNCHVEELLKKELRKCNDLLNEENFVSIDKATEKFQNELTENTRVLDEIANTIYLTETETNLNSLQLEEMAQDMLRELQCLSQKVTRSINKRSGSIEFCENENSVGNDIKTESSRITDLVPSKDSILESLTQPRQQNILQADSDPSMNYNCMWATISPKPTNQFENDLSSMNELMGSSKFDESHYSTTSEFYQNLHKLLSSQSRTYSKSNYYGDSRPTIFSSSTNGGMEKPRTDADSDLIADSFTRQPPNEQILPRSVYQSKPTKPSHTSTTKEVFWKTDSSSKKKIINVQEAIRKRLISPERVSPNSLNSKIEVIEFTTNKITPYTPDVTRDTRFKRPLTPRKLKKKMVRTKPNKEGDTTSIKQKMAKVTAKVDSGRHKPPEAKSTPRPEVVFILVHSKDLISSSGTNILTELSSQNAAASTPESKGDFAVVSSAPACLDASGMKQEHYIQMVRQVQSQLQGGSPKFKRLPSVSEFSNHYDDNVVFAKRDEIENGNESRYVSDFSSFATFNTVISGDSDFKKSE